MLVSRSFVPPGGGSPTPPIPIGLTSPGATGLVADAGHVHAIQVVTTAERDALPTGDGRPVFNSDTLRLEFWNGARWVPTGIEVVTTVQRDALPPTPGRTVFNDDTNRLEYYSGVAWRPAGGSDYTYRELAARYVTTLGNVELEVAGLQHWNPSEHDLANGRRVFFRCTVQSTGAFAVRVKLFNRFFSSYVQNLDGAANDYLTMSGTTPLMLVSDALNIVPHAGFDTTAPDPYEVHVQSMDAGGQAVLGWAQLAVFPAT